MMTDAPIEEDFGKFFDQLSDLGDKAVPRAFGAETPPDPPPAETPPPEPADPFEPAADPVSATPDPEVPPAGEPQGSKGGGDPAPEPAKPEPTEALLERFVKAVENRPAPQPAPQYVDNTPRAPVSPFAPEEVETLTQFEKDWPDVAKALQIMLRGTVAQNNAAIFQQLGETLGPQLAGVQQVQVSQQLMSLRQAIPDYDQVRDPVISWVNTDTSIPAYLRSAYKSVIEQGDVNDIADLVGRWRQVSGKAVSTAAAPEAAKPVNELSEAAKQAAASLAPVVSKRTVTAPSTPTSFDDAFEAAAAAMAKA